MPKLSLFLHASDHRWKEHEKRSLHFAQNDDTKDGVKETLIKSLSAFTLEFLFIARNNLTRIASYLRKAMTKLCIKILVKADSAIESAFP